MNNLLFLGLVLLISIVIVLYFSNAEMEAMTPFIFVDGSKLQDERCEKYNKMKLKMNSPSCGIDNRCDHIKPDVKDEIIIDKDGKINIEKIKTNDCKPSRKAIINLEKTTDDLVTQTNFKIESMTNMTEEPIEKQIKYCKSLDITCDTMGPNCGYCDDNFNGDDAGRIMWTNRGTKGSGSKSVLGRVSDPDGKSCPTNSWYYGDKEQCKKKRRQRMCKLIKSCDIGLSSVILKKNILNNKVLFPNLKTKEDYVLWLKITKLGFIIHGINKNLMKWQESANSLSSNISRKLLDGYSVYRKYMRYNVLRSLYSLLILSFNFIIKKNS